jgi:hypothetical protein
VRPSTSGETFSFIFLNLPSRTWFDDTSLTHRHNFSLSLTTVVKLTWRLLLLPTAF